MATYNIEKITLPNGDVCDFFGGNRTIPGNLVVNGALTIGTTSESSTMVQLKNSNGTTFLHRSGANGGVYDEGLQGWVIMTDGSQVSTGRKLNVKSNDTWPEVSFWANGDVRRGGSVTCGVDTNTNNVYFNEFHRSSGVNSDTYRDTFWLPASDTDNASHNYSILTTKGYSMGNFSHPYAGNNQSQSVSYSSFSTSAGETWTQVPDLTLTAPQTGLYAIWAFATYNNAMPTGLAIITRGSSSIYSNWAAVTDRTNTSLPGTSQYIYASCVSPMNAGEVALVYAKYSSSTSNNTIGLRMYLL